MHNIWDIPRPAWVEVNLPLITHNVREIRRIIKPETEIMAVVKANGYGHGAERVAFSVLDSGANRLGVATLGEGVCLRMAGIMAPIFVLGYVAADQADLAIKYNIGQTVYSFAAAQAISLKAQERNRKALVHIKVDTGMGRIGFLPNEASLEEIVRIMKLPGLFVEGIYTHFSTADYKDKTWTLGQKKIFDGFCEAIENKGYHIPIKHAANSAAMIDMPETHYNMVRPGLAIYGSYPSQEVNHDIIDIIPALSVKARVSYVKKVPAGTPISYGRNYITSEPRIIASLPLGYADGYSRSLSKGGEVLLRGKRVPIVGNICMDQLMVDVTELGFVDIGEKAVIIGKNGNENITIEEIAEKTHTINHEVICLLSERLPRRYIETT
ncbi:MAG: alanine racemase [Clostridia bacterium]|nr:alanine racemase [Clostridia bacterium]